ncbi:hypothetical protein D3C80_538410 [compost metagenome]
MLVGSSEFFVPRRPIRDENRVIEILKLIGGNIDNHRSSLKPGVRLAVTPSEIVSEFTVPQFCEVVSEKQGRIPAGTIRETLQRNRQTVLRRSVNEVSEIGGCLPECVHALLPRSYDVPTNASILRSA